MNWFSENKFLAGFVGAVVVLLGVFGYLTFSAYGDYDTANAHFEEQKTELNRLQNISPFPNDDNIHAVEEQSKTAVKRTEELRTKLATMNVPERELTPQALMDEITSSSRELETKATGHTVLPKDFFIGFADLRSSTPPQKAIPLLNQQLAGVKAVTSILVDARIAEIKTLTREPVSTVTETAPPPRPAPGGKQAGPILSHSTWFNIEFAGKQSAVQSALNQIETHNGPFLVMRAVIVRNDQAQGPLKNADPNNPNNPNPAPTPAPTAAPGQPGQQPDPSDPNAAAPAAPKMAFVVGGQMVDVTMRVEVVQFDVPGGTAKKNAPAAKGGKSGTEAKK